MHHIILPNEGFALENTIEANYQLLLELLPDWRGTRGRSSVMSTSTWVCWCLRSLISLLQSIYLCGKLGAEPRSNTQSNALPQDQRIFSCYWKMHSIWKIHRRICSTLDVTLLITAMWVVLSCYTVRKKRGLPTPELTFSLFKACLCKWSHQNILKSFFLGKNIKAKHVVWWNNYNNRS